MKMKYTSVRNPKWTSDKKTSIECTVNFETIGEIPFCASLNDTEEYTKEIYNRCVAGEFGEIAEFVKVEIKIPEYDPKLYAMYRENAYPPMKDYLDAVVKGDQEAIDNYIAKCKAVKEKYPKP